MNCYSIFKVDENISEESENFIIKMWMIIV